MNIFHDPVSNCLQRVLISGLLFKEGPFVKNAVTCTIRSQSSWLCAVVQVKQKSAADGAERFSRISLAYLDP